MSPICITHCSAWREGGQPGDVLLKPTGTLKSPGDFVTNVGLIQYVRGAGWGSACGISSCLLLSVDDAVSSEDGGRRNTISQAGVGWVVEGSL